nr:RNA polymerase sigma factor [Chitinasiproducens palmae]
MPVHSDSWTDDEALRRRLIGLARQWLSDGEDAEDFVHDTWLRLADSTTPSWLVSRDAWLLTVLRNLCVDAWRRRRRYDGILDRFTKSGVPPIATVRASDPVELLAQAERVEHALLHVVRTVSAGDAATVLLYEVFGFSHAELAVLTGRSEAASRQQLLRVLQRLRRTVPTGPTAANDADAGADDDTARLFALCQFALVQRDPAGLVAVLRAARPQAMASSVQGAQQLRVGAGKRASMQLLQIGNLLTVISQAAGGPLACLPLGETGCNTGSRTGGESSEEWQEEARVRACGDAVCV